MTRNLSLVVLAFAGACVPSPAPPAQPEPPPGVAADVTYLASPELEGREAGTAGGDKAAAYLAHRHEYLHLPGVFRAACDGQANCEPSYFQFFKMGAVVAQNVASVATGSDSLLRHEYVIVGAHYDHLGRSILGALDASAGAVIHPGADDNASGTAAVLELARRFAVLRARRSVIFAHFDAEELGMVGSSVFVDNTPVTLRNVVVMINLDMVGRLRTGGLSVDATRAGHAIRVWADSAAAGEGIGLRYTSLIDNRSDHASFARAGVPTLAFFTGFHSDYHRASDIAARVDMTGILQVVDIAESLIRRAADHAAVAAERRSMVRPPARARLQITAR